LGGRGIYSLKRCVVRPGWWDPRRDWCAPRRGGKKKTTLFCARAPGGEKLQTRKQGGEEPGLLIRKKAYRPAMSRSRRSNITASEKERKTPTSPQRQIKRRRERSLPRRKGRPRRLLWAGSSGGAAVGKNSFCNDPFEEE